MACEVHLSRQSTLGLGSLACQEVWPLFAAPSWWSLMPRRPDVALAARYGGPTSLGVAAGHTAWCARPGRITQGLIGLGRPDVAARGVDGSRRSRCLRLRSVDSGGAVRWWGRKNGSLPGLPGHVRGVGHGTDQQVAEEAANLLMRDLVAGRANHRPHWPVKLAVEQAIGQYWLLTHLQRGGRETHPSGVRALREAALLRVR